MSVFVDSPGVSIVGIDPGGTTGVAVWDSWDKVLYVDQLDAGRGKRARQRVMPGIVESKNRRHVERQFAAQWGIRDSQVKAGRGLRAGKEGERAVQDEIESGIAVLLCDIVAAAGPMTFVVMEDFVIGRHVGGGASGREGLSPVRIACRFDQLARGMGLWNGDYWRRNTRHGWGGADERGWRIADYVVPDYRKRLRSVGLWREEGVDGDGTGLVWGGRGARYVTRMPAARAWLRGGVAVCSKRMKEEGQWVPAMPHAMDALMHIRAFGMKLGAEIQHVPERLG